MVETISVSNLRAGGYKFLAECYYPPDERRIQVWKSCSKSADPSLASIVRNIPPIDNLEVLSVDHSKLFVGPFALLAPPYGSVYLEGERKIHGDSTEDTLNWYGREGLNVKIREVPDHIAIELEFMSFLISKEIEAWESGDKEKANLFLDKQKNFLNAHLGKWIVDFTELVECKAQMLFYKKLAQYTASFIKNDMEYLTL